MISPPRPRTTRERRWELRLLPQPLYRYESTDPDVLDGAVFAFVTSAGTDPEALLVLEARKPAAGCDPVWHYAIARFTDLNLWVRHKGKVVFYRPADSRMTSPQQDPKHRYRVFHDRVPTSRRGPGPMSRAQLSTCDVSHSRD